MTDFALEEIERGYDTWQKNKDRSPAELYDDGLVDEYGNPTVETDER